MVLAKEIEATYEVLAKMGEGGMGAVYKVRHRFFDEIRVIKVMQAGSQATDELKERFLGEARRGKQLRHPNLAEVLDFSIAADGTAYIVMEYIEGINLRQFLTLNNGPLDFRTIVPIAEQVLEALSFLHSRRFVHRDISPDNIMLTNVDGVRRVKLIDLGIAKSLESTQQLTQVGKFIGKVQYASPEQFGGEVDARSDIYSFGLVLYELLTNAKPFTGTDHYSIITGHITKPPRPFTETDPGERVPSDVRAVVMKALEKKPDDRFATAAAFAAALHATLGSNTETTVPEVTLTTTPDLPIAAPPRRMTKWLWIVPVLVVIAILAGALLFMRRPPKEVAVAPVPIAPPTTTTVTVTPTVTASPEPVVIEQGQLVINAFPWGQVASVTDAKGEEQLNGVAETPLVLSLPAGSYKVRLTNPNSHQSVVLDAAVTANTVTRAETQLDRVDVRSYVDAMGIGGSQ